MCGVSGGCLRKRRLSQPWRAAGSRIGGSATHLAETLTAEVQGRRKGDELALVDEMSLETCSPDRDGNVLCSPGYP